MDKKELISISVYDDVMIDTSKILELKQKLSYLLNTEIDNISIEVGYDDTVIY